MKCPSCGAEEWSTKDSRLVENYRRRRLQCRVCGLKLSTAEVPIYVLKTLVEENERFHALEKRLKKMAEKEAEYIQEILHDDYYNRTKQKGHAVAGKRV